MAVLISLPKLGTGAGTTGVGCVGDVRSEAALEETGNPAIEVSKLAALTAGAGGGTAKREGAFAAKSDPPKGFVDGKASTTKGAGSLEGGVGIDLGVAAKRLTAAGAAGVAKRFGTLGAALEETAASGGAKMLTTFGTAGGIVKRGVEEKLPPMIEVPKRLDVGPGTVSSEAANAARTSGGTIGSENEGEGFKVPCPKPFRAEDSSTCIASSCEADVASGVTGSANEGGAEVWSAF